MVQQLVLLLILQSKPTLGMLLGLLTVVPPVKMVLAYEKVLQENYI
jgi:hypothetical protein